MLLAQAPPPCPPPRGGQGPPMRMAVPVGPPQGPPRGPPRPLGGPGPGGPMDGPLLVAHMGRAVHEHLDGRALARGPQQARGMGRGSEGLGLGLRRPGEGGRGGPPSSEFSLAMGMDFEPQCAR